MLCHQLSLQNREVYTLQALLLLLAVPFLSNYTFYIYHHEYHGNKQQEGDEDSEKRITLRSCPEMKTLLLMQTSQTGSDHNRTTRVASSTQLSLNYHMVMMENIGIENVANKN